MGTLSGIFRGIAVILERYGLFWSIKTWIDAGLETLHSDPLVVLHIAEDAFNASCRYGVYKGDGELTSKELNAVVDLCNTLGVTVHQKFNTLLRKTGIERPPQYV